MKLSSIYIKPLLVLLKIIFFIVHSKTASEFVLKVKLIFLGPGITALGLFLYRNNVNNSIIPFLISFLFLNIIDEHKKEIFGNIQPELEKIEYWSRNKITELEGR